MKIRESFIAEILRSEFPNDFQKIYDGSPLLQYLDQKMKAVHGNSKTRRNLANIYAIYSILHFYQEEFYEAQDRYREFEGYEYTKLLKFCRSLYGGYKIQNHALNSRVNGEFHNKTKDTNNDLIIINNGKYLIHICYLYVEGHDISKATCKIITKYIDIISEKDAELLHILEKLKMTFNYSEKKSKLITLLTEDTEARIFEIISYAILKSHYSNITVFFLDIQKIQLMKLHLSYTKQVGQTQMTVE